MSKRSAKKYRITCQETAGQENESNFGGGGRKAFICRDTAITKQHLTVACSNARAHPPVKSATGQGHAHGPRSPTSRLGVTVRQPVAGSRRCLADGGWAGRRTLHFYCRQTAASLIASLCREGSASVGRPLLPLGRGLGLGRPHRTLYFMRPRTRALPRSGGLGPNSQHGWVSPRQERGHFPDTSAGGST